jgi:hypothetical protein
LVTIQIGDLASRLVAGYARATLTGLKESEIFLIYIMIPVNVS